MQLSFIVPGEPLPHGRPRFNKRTGHAYSPERSEHYKKAVALCVRVATTSRGLTGAFSLSMVFYRTDFLRLDIDNLMKSILDGITQSGFWLDDSQVQEVHAKLLRGQKEPRAEIVINEVENFNAKPMLVCQQCGKLFRDYSTTCRPPRKDGKIFCSKECKKIEATVLIACIVCGKDFSRLRAYTKHQKDTCSKKCGQVLRRKNEKGITE